MKTKLIIALLLVSSTLMAQNSDKKFKISKNQWTLGGTIGFSHQSYENPSGTTKSQNTNNSLNIRPDLGYAISDNLLIGIIPNYSFGNFKNHDSDYTDKSKTYGIAPYIRKYFAINEKLAFHLQGEIAYGHQKRDYQETIGLSYYDLDTYFIGLRPGITYGISNKIYLKANLGSLGYSNSKSSNNNQETYKSNSLGFDFSTSDLYFGVLFVL